MVIKNSILFLDSNVTIGYIFKADNWNIPAENVIKSQNQKFYSENVLNETKKKIKIISQEIFQGLLKLSAAILKDYLPNNITLSDIIKVIRNNRLNRLEAYISELFTNLYGYETSKEQASDDIKIIANNFMGEYVQRFRSLQSQLQKHNRISRYNKTHQILKQKIHKEDVPIILDAHDLCHTTNPLIYITADSKEDLINHILKYTKINAVKDLRSFLIYKPVI